MIKWGTCFAKQLPKFTHPALQAVCSADLEFSTASDPAHPGAEPAAMGEEAAHPHPNPGQAKRPTGPPEDKQPARKRSKPQRQAAMADDGKQLAEQVRPVLPSAGAQGKSTTVCK